MEQTELQSADSFEHELTFLIETQLAGTHPGVIRLQELRKGVKRFLGRSHLFLYQLGRETGTVGEHIARAIYDDQTENRQGRYKGPRWDVHQATKFSFIQIIGQPGASSEKERPRKRDVGTVHIPGGLQKQEIITLLAQVIDGGLQSPPDTAYISPDNQPSSDEGRAHNAGARDTFPLIAQIEQNYRKLEGPVIFVATESDGLSIDQCAIGQRSIEAQGNSFYHLFAFEDTGSALLLIDRGVHPLTTPIFLRSIDVLDNPPLYWLEDSVHLLVHGGNRVRQLSSIPHAVENIQHCLANAISSYSVFCNVCDEEYRPALDAQMLQEAASQGLVTTLCPHIWWCSECRRWSNPTARRHLIAAHDICSHTRPAGWESRLSNRIEDLTPPTPLLNPSEPSRENLLVHQDDGSRQAEQWLPGMLYPPREPGLYLSAAPSAGLLSEPPPNQNPLILVTFLQDCYYDAPNGVSDYVPRGTRLIGKWDTEQSEDPSVCPFVVVGGVTWNLGKDQVIASRLPDALTMEQIAREDEALAKQRDEQEDFVEAAALYARAIIEYEALGWTELRLAPLRMNRAGVLLELTLDTDAIDELERAAHAFETQAQNHLNRIMSAHIDYAEHAVDALVPLATIYLRRTHDQTSARRVIARLLALNNLIKKRYERKVDLLLSIADFLLVLGEREEAMIYFEQANRFYSQQLANIRDFPHIAPITQHLSKVRERLGDRHLAQPIRFTITTTTPDDLDFLLTQLKRGQLNGIEVTKGVTAKRTSKDARSGITYVANLRFTPSRMSKEKAEGSIKIQEVLRKIKGGQPLAPREVDVLFAHLDSLALRLSGLETQGAGERIRSSGQDQE